MENKGKYVPNWKVGDNCHVWDSRQKCMLPAKIIRIIRIPGFVPHAELVHLNGKPYMSVSVTQLREVE